MKKFFIILAIVVVALIVGVLLARNVIATYLIEKGIKDMVGLKSKIDVIDIGLFRTDVKVEELRVYNPKGYTQKYLAEVPEIYIDYALMDIIKGFIHLPELRIDIKQVNAEKDKNGVMNIDHVEPAPEPSPKKEEKPDKTKDTKTEFLIDKIEVKIGTIRYIDDTKTPADTKVFDFNYSQTFTNVSDTKTIVASIVTAVVQKLVAKGVSITLTGFLEDKDFMGALIKGDTKGMKEAGKDNLKGLGKKLEKGMFADDKEQESSKPAPKKPEDEGKGAVGKILDNVLKEEKKDK